MAKTSNLLLRSRWVLWTLAALGIGIVVYVAGQTPSLFKADLSGGGDQNVTTDLYIPNTYTATAGSTNYIRLKAGQELVDLSYLTVTFVAPYSKVRMISVDLTGTVLEGKSYTTVTTTEGEFKVAFNGLHDASNQPTPVTAHKNDTLFKILVDVKSGLAEGDQITISRKDGNTNSRLDTGLGASLNTRVPSFTDGQIRVSTSGGLCQSLQCGEHGACDNSTGKCACNTGYRGLLCNECDAGYTGYPKCTLDIFGTLTGAILTLSPDAISHLSQAERLKAYSSAYLILKSTAAIGKTVQVDGISVLIPDSTAGTELDKLQDIASQMVTAWPVPQVNASLVPAMPGVIRLEATAQNPDQSLDGISSNSGDVIWVPGMQYTITLIPASSYKTRVIGVFTDSVLKNSYKKDLNYSDLKWMPQPTNRLKSDALNGGLLEKGDAVGKGPVYVQIERAGAAPIRSNEIVVEVPAGPQIEYARLIGAGSIVRGSRIRLSVKVSDVDTIADIQDIRTSIVRSSFATYAQIQADPSAVWFTATPFLDQVRVVESGTSSGSSGGATQPPAQNYRIYEVPVEIPQDTLLIDGPYKLLLMITDKAGHESAAVLSVRVGAVASGDVNGDGRLTMLDVILAFQIATQKLSNPTPLQIQAADFDTNGAVNLIDVINLFNRVNQKNP